MSTKTIEHLRDYLFAQLADLRATSRDDREALNSELAKASGVAELAKAITDTAKVETDYLRVTDGGESSFISTAVGRSNLPTGLNGVTRQPLPNGIVGITRHVLADD